MARTKITARRMTSGQFKLDDLLSNRRVNRRLSGDQAAAVSDFPSADYEDTCDMESGKCSHEYEIERLCNANVALRFDLNAAQKKISQNEADLLDYGRLKATQLKTDLNDMLEQELSRVKGFTESLQALLKESREAGLWAFKQLHETRVAAIDLLFQIDKLKDELGNQKEGLLLTLEKMSGKLERWRRRIKAKHQMTEVLIELEETMVWIGSITHVENQGVKV